MNIKTLSQLTQPKHAGTAGRVDLVGAGPGDPELLTLKALRSIESADLILYDRLVGDEILSLIPQKTRAIYVGKAKHNHCVPQEQLNQFMVEQAQRGLHICRLKGGDPFIFGRGSEELMELQAAGIASQVIPGITAAAGCSSYAGIPLTHRGLSRGCTFVTGHLKEGKLDLNWTQLANVDHTLVFYMGLSALNEISSQLAAHGLAADTPAALVEKGCHSDQRVVTTTLSELTEQADYHQLESPTLIIIGQVVALREQLNWIEQMTPRPMAVGE
ncbi:uroporphyrinogen-III C-methyltransferase [Aliagarivorans marinus]|uniref:uroporphyrinogen-III C-methyltransferase n=1 Tax=Aliagarivorans marinus TaxID=561965 RepID=UPI0004026B1F|nr:uroporphyrinogen-III C-methyltransferase [Aliagarivorans marinus]